MSEVKGVGRKRETQSLDGLRNRSRYWELKEESEDLKNMETTVYHSNVRKKYKYISSVSP